MTWAASLTRVGIADYLAETYDFDARLHGAYSLLMMRYSLSGPMPNDHKRLADICRVSRTLWSRRIWPVLQEFFTLGNDGLIHHEGLDSVETAASVQARRSAAGKKAARQRWEEDAARKARAADATAHATHADTDATADAIASKSHTQSHAISMLGASEPHADFSADASLGASGASPSAGAPSLSPSALSFLGTQENQEESQGESERARAGNADTSDATADAIACGSHTQSQAPNDATGHAVASPRDVPRGRTRVDPNWQPSKADEAFARGLNYDPGVMAAAMRDHYLSNGETKLDWSATYRGWCRKQPSFGPLAIPGGKTDLPLAKPEPEPDPAIFVGDSHQAQWARVCRALKLELGAAVYRTWLRDAGLDGIDGDEVIILLPTAFIRDYVHTQYLDRLTRLWRAENPGVATVRAEVAASQRRAADG